MGGRFRSLLLLELLEMVLPFFFFFLFPLLRNPMVTGRPARENVWERECILLERVMDGFLGRFLGFVAVGGPEDRKLVVHFDSTSETRPISWAILLFQA